MTIKLKYNFGNIVYLKTDIDQLPRIVTAAVVRGNGYTEYELACGDTASFHTEFEITKDANVLVKMN